MKSAGTFPRNLPHVLLDMPSRKYRWVFSNFVSSTIQGEDSLTYPSVEHYYQAQKTTDIKKRKEVLNLTAAEAKLWGRHLFPLREDWEEVKVATMKYGLRRRYTNEPQRTYLKAATPSDLVEWNNWHDIFWGKCECGKHQRAGENVLGKLLAEVREELLKGLL